MKLPQVTGLHGPIDNLAMKFARPTRLQALAGCALAVGLATWMLLALMPPGEPVWKGHKLSEWIEAQDQNNRFAGLPGRQSPFSDRECEDALAGIGNQALPCLHYWISARPGRLRPLLNKLLDRQRWIRFRFADERDLQGLAASGCLFYGPAAQPLLPELLRLTHSADANTRAFAFELAFFTRPDKEVFLPLACRCLQEKNQGDQAIAAQWMEERFPDEAGKAGLRTRFPLWFAKRQLTSTN